MSIGILLVTHEGIGARLIAVTEAICKQIVSGSDPISLPSDLDSEALGKYAYLIPDAIPQQDQGECALEATDGSGETPNNLAMISAMNVTPGW